MRTAPRRLNNIPPGPSTVLVQRRGGADVDAGVGVEDVAWAAAARAAIASAKALTAAGVTVLSPRSTVIRAICPVKSKGSWYSWSSTEVPVSRPTSKVSSQAYVKGTDRGIVLLCHKLA